MKECGCRCGESVSKQFKPGHDQKLRADLERRVGGILGLRDLVEAAEKYRLREKDSAALADTVEAIMEKVGHAPKA